MYICMYVCVKAMRSVCTPNPHPSAPRWPTQPTTTALKQHPPLLSPPPHALWTWPKIRSHCRPEKFFKEKRAGRLRNLSRWGHSEVRTLVFGFWFLVCYAATHLTIQLQQERTQVVCSNREARKRSTESNGTPEGSIRSIRDPYHKREDKTDVLTYGAGCWVYRVLRIIRPSCGPPIVPIPSWAICFWPLLTEHSTLEGILFSLVKYRHSKLQITTCAENGKIQLTPKITNHLFTYYLNCTCKSNPVCLSQQWSVIFFVGFLCAMTLLSSLGIRKLTHWLFPIYVHSERVGSAVFYFFQWMSTFLYYDPNRFACVRIPTQIQINITIQI